LDASTGPGSPALVARHTPERKILGAFPPRPEAAGRGSDLRALDDGRDQECADDTRSYGDDKKNDGADTHTPPPGTKQRI
jgi:hypothetical protein